MTRLVISLIAIMAGILALDVFLARMEKREVRQEAAARYRAGEQQLAEKHFSEAVESFRRAHALERGNLDYRLGLTVAYAGAGRSDEARSILDESLREHPTSAYANLLNARMLRASGNEAEADVYYHRAIYGAWYGDAAARRIEARLELIHYLAAHGDRRQLLAELLPLEAETQDPTVRREIAALFITAGSPSRAADEYRRMIQSHPEDSGLLTGLGNAELAAGRYGAAQMAFLRAYRLSPNDAAVRHGMELTSALSSLDPTLRRLPSREKFERSARLLKLVRDALDGCVPLPAELPKSRDFSNEAAEQRLQAAEDLWRERSGSCQAPELVVLIMEKLGLP